MMEGADKSISQTPKSGEHVREGRHRGETRTCLGTQRIQDREKRSQKKGKARILEVGLSPRNHGGVRLGSRVMSKMKDAKQYHDQLEENTDGRWKGIKNVIDDKH